MRLWEIFPKDGAAGTHPLEEMTFFRSDLLHFCPLHRSGNAYLPGILNALVVTMITIAGTSFSHPY